jgi:hypothetical protein
MVLQAVRFVALNFAALGLTLGASHTLELPVKLSHDAGCLGE